MFYVHGDAYKSSIDLITSAALGLITFVGHSHSRYSNVLCRLMSVLCSYYTFSSSSICAARRELWVNTQVSILIFGMAKRSKACRMSRDQLTTFLKYFCVMHVVTMTLELCNFLVNISSHFAAFSRWQSTTIANWHTIIRWMPTVAGCYGTVSGTVVKLYTTYIYIYIFFNFCKLEFWILIIPCDLYACYERGTIQRTLYFKCTLCVFFRNSNAKVQCISVIWSRYLSFYINRVVFPFSPIDSCNGQWRYSGWLSHQTSRPCIGKQLLDVSINSACLRVIDVIRNFISFFFYLNYRSTCYLWSTTLKW